MKKVTLILISIVMTLSSFTSHPSATQENISAAEQMALDLVASLQESSPQSYTELFPKLSEFQQLMNENKTIYGPFLHEAQEDFARDYNSKLLPAVKESFNALITEGKKKGIVWSQIRFIKVEAADNSQSSLTAVPFTIVVSSQGKEYSIRVEKAFFINGQWKVSQFIKLA